MFKNIIYAGAITLLFNAPAIAQTSGLDLQDNFGQHTHVGTFCTLELNGDQIYSGLCNIMRRGNNTLINTGNENYIIERDPFDNHSASFNGPGIFGSNRVYANGSCWIGRNIKYCAK